MHLDQSICHLLLLFRQQSIQNRDFVEVFHLRFWQVCTLRCTTPACHSLPNLKKETHPQNQAVSFSITAPHDSPSAFMTYTSPPSPVFSSRPSRAAYALILESEACAAAERRGEGPEIPKPNRGRTRRAVGFLGGSGRWAVPQVIQVRRTPKFRTPKAPSKLRDFLEERVSTNPAEDILDHLRGVVHQWCQCHLLSGIYTDSVDRPTAPAFIKMFLKLLRSITHTVASVEATTVALVQTERWGGAFWCTWENDEG